MENLPIGAGTQQLPAQHNPNPNNTPIQLIQIIEDPKPKNEQK